MLRREGRLGARLLRRLDDLVANTRRIIAVNRNLGFFTTGYNYLIQIIPVLIVAPLFIRGEAEFGVITQSSMAFSHLLGAFSLIVTQFQQISSYAVVLARLSALGESTDQVTAHSAGGIEVDDGGSELAWQGLSLRSRREDRVLLQPLTLAIAPGTRVLVTGANEAARIALFRASAGLWKAGEGRIVRPPPGAILFVPERPYLPPGTLRDALLRTEHEHDVAEARIAEALREVGVEDTVARAGGLAVERDWDDLLSLADQQRISFARVLLAAPRYAVLEGPGTALGAEAAARFLDVLAARSVTAVTFAGQLVAPPPADAPADAAGRQAGDAAAAARFWRGMTGPLELQAPASEDATRLAAILPWFAHDAWIHHLAPRGLEQYSGGGWGTRDVCQGPVELLLSLGRLAPVRATCCRACTASRTRTATGLSGSCSSSANATSARATRTATSWSGRCSLGLMYTHAHLRWAEALAHLGDGEAAFHALRQANPVGLRDAVPSARLRQANCYTSSSDADFADRADAAARYDAVRTGTVGIEGGWRVYSSGAGIAVRLVRERLLGLRLRRSSLCIDPVLPRALDGLVARVELEGRALTLRYRVGPLGHGPRALACNGRPLAIEREAHAYRTGGAVVALDALRARLRDGDNDIDIESA
jgi:ABC-type transport system involved in cytochrome c biogenesis ATPase subunit